MDQITPVQSNITGNYSGNRGDNSIFGHNNSNTTYINLLPNVTELKAGNQSCVPGEGGEAKQAPGPYRLKPYGRNGTFTGRKNHIESIKKFSESQDHTRVALYGLGGSGKTQIALAYVYQCIDESDCDVFWVQGSGLLKFTEGFRAVARHVRIPLAGETGEDLLLGVKRWFEGPSSGGWILVIDNADNEADFTANNSAISKFIPQGTKGTLVFTTRSRQVASRQGCRMIEVGKMTEGEATELFSKRFAGWDSLEDEEKEVVAKILGSVDHLPLAIIGSAAFMTETATPPSLYWAMIQENEDRMKKLFSREFSDIQRESDVTESILGTFFATFDRIRQQMPAAADLLRLMAFFDRQNIPEELLSQSGLEGVHDSVDLREAVGKLLGFSLITIAKREDRVLYELHRLVQLSLQVYLPIGDLDQGRAAALRVVSRFFPDVGDGMMHMGPAYISHALAVTRESMDPTAQELCFRMGWYFVYKGSYDEAERQARRCIALSEGGRERDRLNYYGSGLGLLAAVNAYQGKYAESEAIYRRLLEEEEKILGPDHPETLTNVGNLAQVLSGQGKYDESAAMNRRALEGFEKDLGPDHPDTLSSVNNLALILRYQGKLDESETMNRCALEGLVKALGPDHPATLKSVSSLASVLSDQGKYDESETMNRRALEGREKSLGPDHPDTLLSVRNLATALSDQGKYDESETIIRRALEGIEKVLGQDHPATLPSVRNLAAVLQKPGKCDKPEAVSGDAQEAEANVLGSDHLQTLTNANNLAQILNIQGDHDEQEPMFQGPLEEPERVLEPAHQETLASITNLAAVVGDQSMHDEPEAMSGHEQEKLPRKPHWKRLRSIGATVLRFLRAVLCRKDNHPNQ